MATLNSRATPTGAISGGIRHPRLPHQFSARFIVELADPRPGDDLLIDALASELLRVELSPETIGVISTGSHDYATPRPARLADETVFHFQDDVTGDVARALDLLGRATRVRAVVMLLDGNATVLEAWWLALTLRRIVAPRLNYGPHGLSLHGHLENPADLDENGNPLRVSVALSQGTPACERRLVVTTPRASRAIFNRGGATIHDVLAMNP